LFPRPADFVVAPKQVATARRNEENFGAARKQAHYFFRVKQSVPFKKLMVQFLICGKHITGQNIGSLRDNQSSS
jgi:hypothetical protein